MAYSPGQLEIIEAWANANVEGNRFSVYGEVLLGLVEGNVNFIDEFSNVIDEDWLNVLANLMNRIDALEDAPDEEEDNDYPND